MKEFLAIFAMCLILCYTFLFFVGGFVFRHIHAAIVLVALVIAIPVTVFIKQAIKIEELETRIRKLESDE